MANQVKPKISLNLQSITHRSSARPRRLFTAGEVHEVHTLVCQSLTQFHGATFHLVLVPLASLHSKYGKPYLLTF